MYYVLSIVIHIIPLLLISMKMRCKKINERQYLKFGKRILNNIFFNQFVILFNFEQTDIANVWIYLSFSKYCYEFLLYIIQL